MRKIELRRDGDISLARQIYRAFRDQMADGQLQSGEPIPSTRELAQQLGVSRNTACEAYDMLLSEGFVISRQGAPTRVADAVCLDRPHQPTPPAHKTAPERLIRADFRTGQPELRQFPQTQWFQMVRTAHEKLPVSQLGYTGPAGLPALREEIAAWLIRSKGLEVSPEDIFITSGATHALNLISDLLCRNGRGIIAEDPSHTGLIRVLQADGRPVHPVPVDEHGLKVELLQDWNAGAIYVTPSHQFPLGGILPAGRRTALIRFAAQTDAYIVEDDYDSEFRYCGEPIAPLCSMAPERVVYVGTFSKVLFPALRIGYAVLPRLLHERWKHLRTHSDVQNPPLEQAALAEFLRERKFDRHIRRMRRLYGERRSVLLDTLAREFSVAWRPWGDAAGLHIALQFPGLRLDGGFEWECARRGIRLTSVERHAIQKGSHTDKLLLGYGHLDPDEIRAGVAALREVIENG